jgi:hypothetical protein
LKRGAVVAVLVLVDEGQMVTLDLVVLVVVVAHIPNDYLKPLT